jgi:antitoxin component YwqK of YwqJK toxin-antitoxin module
MKHYRSSIPKAARERVVATFVSGPQKYMARCTLNGKLVGVRFFHETGELEHERPLRNGERHGIEYRSDVSGKLLSAEPYYNGLPHGVARQWSHGGKLLGTYTMNHGTGIDLWWQEHGGRAHLSEARYVKNGKWHGFERWLDALHPKSPMSCRW